VLRLEKNYVIKEKPIFENIDQNNNNQAECMCRKSFTISFLSKHEAKWECMNEEEKSENNQLYV
jgi:hypothetical protein